MLEQLKAYFGFDRFLPLQEEIINKVLAKRDTLVLMPTGGGKSLCYQLPALRFKGLTLVVSPLIALMKDQIDTLTGLGIAAARLDSTLSADEYRDCMQRASAGDLRMLYVAPERFQNERFREAIKHLHVSLFAVDEAHCISEWGHNFRPDYLKLVEFARHCRAERLLALTATATPQVLADICRAFDIETECAVCNSCYRANLTILTTPVDLADRDALLVERLRERTPGPTIIYVTLQRTAEALARVLRVALRLAVALAADFRLLVGLRAVVFLFVPRVAERLRVLARFCVLERLVFARFKKPPVNAFGDWRHNSIEIVPTGRGLAKCF